MNKTDKPQVVKDGMGRWPRFIIVVILVVLTIVIFSADGFGMKLLGIFLGICSLSAIVWWIEGPEIIAVVSGKDKVVKVVPKKEYVYVECSSASEKTQKKKKVVSKMSTHSDNPNAISKVNVLSNGNLSVFVGGKKVGSIVCEGKLKGWGDDFVVVQKGRTVTTYDIDGDVLGTLEMDKGERISAIHSGDFIVSNESNCKTRYNKWC